MTFTTLILLVFYVNFQFFSFISFIYLLFIYLFIIYLVICRFNSILFFIILNFINVFIHQFIFLRSCSDWYPPLQDLKFLAIPHLFERLFLISWENDRDCLITIPLSLKTVEVQIRRVQVCLELWGHVDIFFSNYYNLQSVYFELECRCRCR